MESNIHRQGVTRLPDPTSFQRRNNYHSKNPASPQAGNMYKNNFKSIDGRNWGSQDQTIAANRELYTSLNRDPNHKAQNPQTFGQTNFNRFGGD